MPVPDRLYKYRAFDARTVELLVEDKAHSSDPSTFNDPLDTRPTLVNDLGVSDLELLLETLTTRRSSAEMKATAKRIRYSGPRTIEDIDQRTRRQVGALVRSIAYMATEFRFQSARPWASLLLISCVFCIQTVNAQKILPAQTDSVTAETSMVSAPDGRRHDQQITKCIDAPMGSAFATSTLKAFPSERTNLSAYQCTFGASNYKEFVPNFQEPARVCFTASVVSVGAPSYGARGKVTCQFEYALYDRDTLFKPPAQAKNDVVIPNSSFPLQLNFGYEAQSFVEVATPIRGLNERVRASLDAAIKNLDPSFDVKIPSQGFLQAPFDSRELNYFMDLDVNAKSAGIDVGFRCDVLVRFIIPISKLRDVSLIDGGTNVNCRIGNDILRFLDYQNLLNSEISKQLKKLSMERINLDQILSADLAEEDRELFTFMEPAWLYGRHCNWKSEAAICFGLTWSDRNAFAKRFAKFSTPPVANSSPHDIPKADESLSFFYNWAMSEGYWPDSQDTNRFATGFAEFGTPVQKIEDYDIVLFSGIMCTFYISQGCDTVRNSLDPDGRPWRSPRRINETADSSLATFSGDHLKGMILYWIAQRDTTHFRKFLQYVKTQVTYSPSTSLQLQKGYSTCTQREPNFTCVIGGDWEHIAAVAKLLGVEDELPKDIYSILADNQLSVGAKKIESYFSITGYRLHLVAASTLIESGLGYPPYESQQTFKVLANRQPLNPYFAFLNEGKTKRVQDLLDSQCPRDKTRTPREDWAWQRADFREAWKHGMIWDCFLGYSLLR